MSGSNINILDMPPGFFGDNTVYATGKRWRKGNLVRWLAGVMQPIGGWNNVETIAHVEPIRDLFSWRDYLKAPWFASGSHSKLFVTKKVDTNYNTTDITPVGLSTSPIPVVGYGAGPYGEGPYGIGGTYVPDAEAQWSFDNFGRQLVATHSQDGRLFMWDPFVPLAVAALVPMAPVDNTIVIVTEEQHVMVLGGQNNPRKVKWSSRADLNDWTPTETNSAGGFDLKANGAIISAKKVQGGIIVHTDADVHLIEYIGPPNYYSRRKISEDGGIVSKNSIAAIPGGCVWISDANFWVFDGNISKMECPLYDDVFKNSNLSLPTKVFMGVNEHNQEVWTFFPAAGGIEASKYVFFSYSKEVYWSMGLLARTAWLNPVWQSRPLMADVDDIYEHEVGYLADGVSRNADIYATTGGVEIGEGDRVARVDRIYHDTVVNEDPAEAGDVPAYELNFGLRQAPNAPLRSYGPVTLNAIKGYTTIKFRARQITLTVNQIADEFWTLGKMRLRVKEGGRR